MGLKESGLRGSLRNVSVGISAIPDSLGHQYLVGDFSTDGWPDSEGDQDIDTINGLTLDETAFGGTGGIVSTSDDEFGEDGQMVDFRTQLDTDIAVSIPFNTEDSGGAFTGVDEGGPSFSVGMKDFITDQEGQLTFRIRDDGDNDLRVRTDATFNDGQDHHLIVNKTGNGPEDIDFYIDDMEEKVDKTVTSNETVSDFDESNINANMGYFRRGAAEDRNQNGALGDIRYFFGQLDESERKAVHDQLPWT